MKSPRALFMALCLVFTDLMIDILSADTIRWGKLEMMQIYKDGKWVSPEEYNKLPLWMSILVKLLAVVFVLFLLGVGICISLGVYMILAEILANAFK